LVNLLIIMFVIGIVGVLLDKFVVTQDLTAWRATVKNLWVKLNTPGAKDLVQDANQLFLGLFEAVYGVKTFSWRRFWSSNLSSIIALVAFTILLGYEGSGFEELASDYSLEDFLLIVLVVSFF